MKIRLRVSVCSVLFALATICHASTFSVTATASGWQNVFNTQTGSTAATAHVNNNNGIGSATALAEPGHLGAVASVTGCGSDPLFEQVCNSDDAQASFNDILNVVGGPVDTPVTIELILSADATVGGIGAYGFEASLVAGNTAVGVSSSSGGIVQPVTDLKLGGSKTIVIDTSIGATIPIGGFLDINVADRYCAGGGQDCVPSLSWTITGDASQTMTVTGIVLTPGVDVQLIGDSGHNYAPVAAAPEPSSLILLGFGLAALARLRRKSRY